MTAPRPTPSNTAPSDDAPATAHETVVVLDFGGQTAMLITRRIRQSNVYSELVPFDAPWEQVQKLNPRGIILSGGPASVYDEGAPQAPDWVFDSGLPVLGICYGMQLLAHQLGGKVAPSPQREDGRPSGREFGPATIHQSDPANPVPLFDGLPAGMPVWMSHGDKIVDLPNGFRSLAYSDNSPLAVIGDDRGHIGLQFHPEVVHTPNGGKMLENFLYKICGCSGDWTAGHFVAETVAQIRAQVGDGRVICALSGGVDSAVTAALVHRAIGDQITCVFVNNGLLRKDEPERVVDTFHRHLKMNLIHAKEQDRFLDLLKGVTDPEQKRKIVGETFIRVFEEQADQLFGPPGRPRQSGRVGAQHAAPGGAGAGPPSSDPRAPSSPDFIAQGTTYPDVIESGAHGHTTGANAAHVIKSHHNVGGLPKEMTFDLVEPLRYLFKDEVRNVGLELGLPKEIVFRQPFPGPGLAIRVIGEVTREKLEALRACDWIVMDEIKAAGQYDNLWQAFAILTDTRSVGVMGDLRTYGWVVALRAVTAEDAMTADWARLPYDLLAKIANRIVNEVPAVNRVVYDITSKPPGTIEWE
ncbi:MAG: glutamine-hydrolyzing GMP synthase [Chloroflexi bacterium]|nr:glutamine-hydrolyzing GMP synthase [Chloroflexota bacterium]